MPSLTLNAASGQAAEATFALDKPITSVGSAPTNDVVLPPADGVLSNHAVIHFDGSSFQIQTVHRSAGLLVNGKRKRKQTLSHQDRLQLGSAQLVVNLLDGASSNEDTAQLEFELHAYRKLQELSRDLLGEYRLEALLEGLMDVVVEITGADKGFLILASEGDFEIKVARNMRRETLEGALEEFSDSIVAKVLKTRHPLIVSDALNHSEFKSAQSVVNLRLSSVMCVPLMHKGDLLGVIYVGNESIASLFTKVHLDLLHVFATQASLILVNALMVHELRLDRTMLSQRIDDMRFGSIIGACDAMREIFRIVDKVAATQVNVLVLGETGTGKELIAKELHNRSDRASGPFITINCGAIPESLLESELFGHVKGAFTGAQATREGKFQAADGGTIFLDEIGEMPLNLQVKLLRVLQDRTITKVGATASEKVDIRVVAATNVLLEDAVQNNEFREDLYYRLNVVQVRLPPLRKRGDDVTLIAKSLIQKICEEQHIGLKRLAPETIQAMKKYAWPGNIRQLENRLKKAIVLSDSSALTPDDLDLPPEVLQPTLTLADAKERFAYRYIMEALERNGDNRTQTAKELGVDPRTIFRYLEKDMDEV
ncbi:MAG: sigma 54-interacting transcriptional regulator [Myxococcota bacterium]